MAQVTGHRPQPFAGKVGDQAFYQFMGAYDLQGKTGTRGCLAVQAVDVLGDHDRVVDQQPDTKCEAAEGHDVQRGPGLVHQEEGRDDRDRNRDPDDQRAAKVLEEEEQHQELDRDQGPAGREHEADQDQ